MMTQRRFAPTAARIPRNGCPLSSEYAIAEPTARKRFSCAHELGHYVMAADVGIENLELVEYRDRSSSYMENPVEIYENQFAASLLMPERLVQKRHSENKKSLAGLAKSFGVSIQAMARRIQTLGLTHA